jgi:hypothetical protein
MKLIKNYEQFTQQTQTSQGTQAPQGTQTSQAPQGTQGQGTQTPQVAQTPQQGKPQGDPQKRMVDLLEELARNIKYWFDKGALSTQGLTLYDLEKSFQNDIMQKNINFNFSDQEWYYSVNISITLEEASNNAKIENAYMTIKKYDMQSEKLVRTWSDGIKVDDIKADLLIMKISELDDKTDKDIDNTEEISDQNADLNDNIH